MHLVGTRAALAALNAMNTGRKRLYTLVQAADRPVMHHPFSPLVVQAAKDAVQQFWCLLMHFCSNFPVGFRHRLFDWDIHDEHPWIRVRRHDSLLTVVLPDNVDLPRDRLLWPQGF